MCHGQVFQASGGIDLSCQSGFQIGPSVGCGNGVRFQLVLSTVQLKGHFANSNVGQLSTGNQHVCVNFLDGQRQDGFRIHVAFQVVGVNEGCQTGVRIGFVQTKGRVHRLGANVFDLDVAAAVVGPPLLDTRHLLGINFGEVQERRAAGINVVGLLTQVHNLDAVCCGRNRRANRNGTRGGQRQVHVQRVHTFATVQRIARFKGVGHSAQHVLCERCREHVIAGGAGQIINANGQDSGASRCFTVGVDIGIGFSFAFSNRFSCRIHSVQNAFSGSLSGSNDRVVCVNIGEARNVSSGLNPIKRNFCLVVEDGEVLAISGILSTGLNVDDHSAGGLTGGKLTFPVRQAFGIRRAVEQVQVNRCDEGLRGSQLRVRQERVKSCRFGLNRERLGNIHKGHVRVIVQLIDPICETRRIGGAIKVADVQLYDLIDLGLRSHG